jgi:hypothetical protein
MLLTTGLGFDMQARHTPACFHAYGTAPLSASYAPL